MEEVKKKCTGIEFGIGRLAFSVQWAGLLGQWGASVEGGGHISYWISLQTVTEADKWTTNLVINPLRFTMSWATKEEE